MNQQQKERLIKKLQRIDEKAHEKQLKLAEQLNRNQPVTEREFFKYQNKVERVNEKQQRIIEKANEQQHRLAERVIEREQNIANRCKERQNKNENMYKSLNHIYSKLPNSLNIEANQRNSITFPIRPIHPYPNLYQDQSAKYNNYSIPVYPYPKNDEASLASNYNKSTSSICYYSNFHQDNQKIFRPINYNSNKNNFKCIPSAPYFDDEQLKSSIIKNDEENMCKICMDNEIECVFNECGHMICCMKCSTNIKLCPFCRKDVVKAIKFYK